MCVPVWVKNLAQDVKKWAQERISYQSWSLTKKTIFSDSKSGNSAWEAMKRARQ